MHRACERERRTGLGIMNGCLSGEKWKLEVSSNGGFNGGKEKRERKKKGAAWKGK